MNSMLKRVSLVISCSLISIKAVSYTRVEYAGNCLNCINNNLDFCSAGTLLGTVDPINGVCCQGMQSNSDTCKAGNDACTYRDTTKNKYSKFFSCRKNSRCIKQPNLDDYIISAFNTQAQTIVMNKL